MAPHQGVRPLLLPGGNLWRDPKEAMADREQGSKQHERPSWLLQQRTETIRPKAGRSHWPVTGCNSLQQPSGLREEGSRGQPASYFSYRGGAWEGGKEFWIKVWQKNRSGRKTASYKNSKGVQREGSWASAGQCDRKTVKSTLPPTFMKPC